MRHTIQPQGEFLTHEELESHAPSLLAASDISTINGLFSAISLVERTDPDAQDNLDYLKIVASCRLGRATAYLAEVKGREVLSQLDPVDVAINEILREPNGTE